MHACFHMKCSFTNYPVSYCNFNTLKYNLQYGIGPYCFIHWIVGFYDEHIIASSAIAICMHCDLGESYLMTYPGEITIPTFYLKLANFISYSPYFQVITVAINQNQAVHDPCLFYINIAVVHLYGGHIS